MTKLFRLPVLIIGYWNLFVICNLDIGISNILNMNTYCFGPHKMVFLGNAKGGVMEKAVIVAACRTPIGKAIKGSCIYTRIDDIAAELVKSLLERVPELNPEKIEDIMIGCAMPEGDQGLNVARNISFLSGLPLSLGAATINRFCASSLETINSAAQAIMTGNGEAFIAGGIETMTHVPMGGFNPSLNEKLMGDGKIAAYIGMGQTAENLAVKYNISREDQDQFALDSHLHAAKAWDDGAFSNEVVPVTVHGKDGSDRVFEADECVRKDTTIEKLAGLKPAFIKDGTVTAGNSSPLSDGVAAVIVMSEKLAKKLKIKPLVRIRSMAIAGVDPAYMGMGPVEAIPKALKRGKFKPKDIDLIELNEAFAAQSLAVIRELKLNPEVVNVHGGAVALGHPLGCSGSRIMTTLIYALKRHGKSVGMATMCVGGGQGVALIVENV